MMSELPLLVNIMIAIYLYWWAVIPALSGVFYLVVVRMFTMPLLTRNPHELVVIFSPSKVYVVKVVSRRLPYFKFRHGVYWFGEPLQMGHNLVHVYFEGIDQPITALERNDDKEADILTHREIGKMIASHSIIRPPSMKSFERNWVLIINGKKADLLTTTEAKIKVKQHYKLGIGRRMGLYLSEPSATSAESTNASASNMQSITLQQVQQKIGAVVRGTNFSSSYMYNLLRGIIRLDLNWIRWLTAAMNPIIILIILGGILAAAAVFFLNQPPDTSSLGPPPPGLFGR